MTLQQTIEYARRLFVELWVRLSTDHSFLQVQEGEILRDEVLETDTEAREVLDQGSELSVEWNAIVRLRALDAFLVEQSGPRATGVDVQLGIPIQLEDGKVHLLYRRPQGVRRAPVEGKMGHVRRWTRHHWVLPEKPRGYHVEVVKPSDSLLQQLTGMHARGERLKVAIGRFEDGVTVKWRARRPPHFQAEALTDPDARWKTVSELLERARDAGAHVLVLPELTVPPDLRLRIQGWLEEHSSEHSLLLVLPGTFHEPDPAGKSGEVVNRTKLLDAYGQPVMEHRKLLRFGAWESGVEDINTGTRIQLLSSPLGLLSIPICLDFCEADQPLPEIWKDLGPAWLLVSAMGEVSNRKAHAVAAKSLFVTRGSVTVLANQPKEGVHAPGFVCDSLKSDPTLWMGEPVASFQVIEVDIRLDEPQEGSAGLPVDKLV